MNTTGNVSRDMLADAAIHEHWVAKYRTPETQRFYELAFDEIVRRLDAPPDSTILDAGCSWFEAEGERLGLKLTTRMPGQLNRLYVLAPQAWIRRAIHGLNHAWFRHVGLPGPAFGNILMFEKRS